MRTFPHRNRETNLPCPRRCRTVRSRERGRHWKREYSDPDSCLHAQRPQSAGKPDRRLGWLRKADPVFSHCHFVHTATENGRPACGTSGRRRSVPRCARDAGRRVRRRNIDDLPAASGVFRRGCRRVRANSDGSKSSTRFSKVARAARNSAKSGCSGRALWLASSVFRLVRSAGVSWPPSAK